MNNLDDYTLLNDFNAGKEYTYKKVFYLLYPEFFSYATKIIKIKEDAEEITMTAFSKLFGMEKNFESIRNVRYFLFKIIKNACLNRIRNKAQKINDLKSFIKEPHEQFDSFEFEFEIKPEIIRRLHAVIDLMPEQRKRIIQMMFIDGKDAAEVAKEIGVSTQTVYAQKHIALSEIKKLI